MQTTLIDIQCSNVVPHIKPGHVEFRRYSHGCGSVAAVHPVVVTDEVAVLGEGAAADITAEHVSGRVSPHVFRVVNLHSTSHLLKYQQ